MDVPQEMVPEIDSSSLDSCEEEDDEDEEPFGWCFLMAVLS